MYNTEINNHCKINYNNYPKPLQCLKHMEFRELSGPKKLLLWVDGPLATACDLQLSLQQAQVSAIAVCAVYSTVPHWEGSGASCLSHF